MLLAKRNKKKKRQPDLAESVQHVFEVFQGKKSKEKENTNIY